MKSDYNKPAKEGWSRSYEKAWLKLHGKICPKCKGSGILFYSNYSQGVCTNCGGVCYIEKSNED